jgi:hypothetical protein
MKKYLIGVGVIVLLAPILILLPTMRTSTDALVPADIESITVQMENRPDDGRDELFVAATADHGRLLALIQGGTVEPAPLKWQFLGVMDFVQMNGSKMRVDMYWTGRGTAAWRIGHSYYRGSTDAEMIRVIADCAGRGTRITR